jgi:mannose-1-phosphate guanylyltransferase
MAGGVGSRFWPLSKSDKPKQFIDILGIGKTFLQLTFERLNKICPSENFYIVTNKAYKDIVLEQLPMLSDDQILLEPKRRNTAPCIEFANYKIATRCSNANIIVCPSDHLILKEDEFIRVVNEGISFIENKDALLTLGIKPSRPDTGYGYIQIDKNKSENNSEINKVKTFTEKPNIDLAKFFFESGEFFWNSGIFIWSLSSIDKAFSKYLPEVSQLFKNRKSFKSEDEFIDKTYSECPNISIDYGVMEKADNVFVYKADFGWSDLGTWGSLYDNTEKDENKNALIGDSILLYETQNCVFNIPSNKVVVAQGLDGYIVVDSGESLLICKKEEEQRIRQFVNDIQIKKGESFV